MTPLKKNLALLQQHHPELFSLVQNPISTSHITVLPTKNGAAQLLVTTATGTTVPLHESDNPLQPIQLMAKQMAPSLSGVRVVLGFELGYLAKFLCVQLPENAALVFYEADPAIFLMALSVVDLTDVLSHPRVAIHVGPQATLQHTCSEFLSQVGGPLETTAYGPSFTLSPDLYEEKIQRELTQMISLINSAQQVMEWNGWSLTSNVLENMPHVMVTPSALPLQHAFQNVPAVLVAAGPSLAKNVSHLKAAKGRSIIVAADSALKYLLDHDVVPDFVVSVDPQEATSRKFRGYDIPQDVTLLYHPATHHELVNQFPGPKLTMDVPLPAYEWLHSHGTPKGRFDQEATCQIQVGFNFAAWMGCHPMILVGHDLCFTDEGMHVAAGSYLSSEENTRQVHQGQPIEDQHGQPVRTNPTLTHDKLVLEKKIRDFFGTVINATEGGLIITGAQPSSLQDALTTYGTDLPIDVQANIHQLLQDLPLTDTTAMEQDIQDQLRDIFRIERTAHHVCRILTEMKNQNQESGEPQAYVHHLGKQVEHLTSFMPRYPQAQALILGMDKQMSQRFEQDTLTCDQETNPSLKMDLQIERGLRYYHGLLGVTPSLRKMLLRLMNRFSPDQELSSDQANVASDYEASEMMVQ